MALSMNISNLKEHFPVKGRKSIERMDADRGVNSLRSTDTIYIFLSLITEEPVLFFFFNQQSEDGWRPLNCPLKFLHMAIIAS